MFVSQFFIIRAYSVVKLRGGAGTPSDSKMTDLENGNANIEHKINYPAPILSSFKLLLLLLDFHNSASISLRLVSSMY
jgi:hypothetical protein